MATTEVIGHFLIPANGRPAQPLLHESTALFQDVVSDNLASVETAVEADVAKLNQLFLILHWASDAKGSGTSSSPDSSENLEAGSGVGSKASVMVKQRSLLMIAAHSGSLRVLAYLLARGAEPGRKAPDGMTAYEMAVAGEASQAPTAIAMMRDADSHGPASSSTRSSSTADTHSFSGNDRSNSRDLGVDTDGSQYSTADLTRPEYSTDEFRMFNFKVLRCSKRHAHDWRACPFAHPTENARRRDPREFKYCALACPDYKQGFCIRGDMCPYAHGVFECWLHPSRYRTQLCKDGSNCHRPVCFFAHSLTELRAPTYTWVPAPGEVPRAGAQYAGGNGQAAPAGTSAGGASQGAMNRRGDGRMEKRGEEGATGAATGPARGSSPALASPQAGEQVLLKAISGVEGSLHAPSNVTANGHMHNAPNCNSPRAVSAVGHGSGSGSGTGGGSPSGSVSSKDGNCSSSCAGHHDGQHGCGSKGDGKGHGPNLTVPNPAASMLGFTAPRMSNAFARRHGLNPRDNPMINLQKIALQSHQQPQVPQQMVPQAVPGRVGTMLTGMNFSGAMTPGAGPDPAAVAMLSGGAVPANRLAVGMGLNGAGVNGAYGAGAYGVTSPAFAAGGGLAGGPGAGGADPALLAAQLAALNMQSQQQVHVQQQRHAHHHHHFATAAHANLSGLAMGVGTISGIAAAAAGMTGMAAAPYMSAAGQHQALMHQGVYGSGAALYEHPQGHLMAAMGGAQTEV